MRTIFLTMVLALTLQLGHVDAMAQEGPTQPAKSHLTNLLAAELSRFPGKAGVYVKHLGTGEEASVHAADRFESASTIKLGILVLAFRMADEKKLDLNERYELKAADLRGGSGIFKYKDLGLKPTYRDILTEMVITSDNTATDIMVAKVGGRDKLNEFLRQSGYTNLRLNRTTLEYFRMRYEELDPRYKTLSAQDVFALQNNRPAFVEPRRDLIAQIKSQLAAARAKNPAASLSAGADDETSWFGIASPMDMGRLLEGIERGTIASKASCEEMVRILRGQQVTHKLPHYLSVPVANKTGDTGPVTNDVGIIYAHSGPIVVSFYTSGTVGPSATTDDRIGAAARLIVDYFDEKQ